MAYLHYVHHIHTVYSYRHMNGYGSHTFKTVSETGEAFYVKWHFKTDQVKRTIVYLLQRAILHISTLSLYVYVCVYYYTQGIRNLPAERAGQLASSDPDYAIRDLYNAIATKVSVKVVGVF